MGYGDEESRYDPGFPGYNAYTRGEKANKLINNISIGGKSYVENKGKDG